MKIPSHEVFVLVGYYTDGSLNPNDVFGVFLHSEDAHRLKEIIEFSEPNKHIEVVETMYWE